MAAARSSIKEPAKTNSKQLGSKQHTGRKEEGRTCCTPYRSAKQSRLCGLISNCFPSEYFFSRYLITKKRFFDARFASGRLCSAQIRADPQPAQRAKKIFFLASRNFSIKPR